MGIKNRRDEEIMKYNYQKITEKDAKEIMKNVEDATTNPYNRGVIHVCFSNGDRNVFEYVTDRQMNKLLGYAKNIWHGRYW